MERITVNLGERSYPISIGAGLFANPALLSLSAKQKVVIVTNTLSLRCMRLRSFHYLITSVASMLCWNCPMANSTKLSKPSTL